MFDGEGKFISKIVNKKQWVECNQNIYQQKKNTHIYD